jgi:hypothetical protein
VASERPMHFDRFGRTCHLSIRSAEDLQQVVDLDDSLWIAMSAPVAGLNCDRRFLDLVDLDHNGRIRTDEMRAAVRWLYERLADRSGVSAGSDVLPLAAIDNVHPEAADLLDTAGYVLTAVGAQDRTSVSLGQVVGFEQHVSSSAINGDGIVPPLASADPGVEQFIRDVVACYGGQKDMTGRAGVNDADVERFMHDARAFLDWAALGDLPEGKEATDELPLGAQTAAAYAALQAVRPKLDSFYARCAMVRFRPEVAAGAGIEGWETLPADFRNAATIADALQRAPLSEPNPEGVLSFGAGVNPAYAEALEGFHGQVVEPMLGEVQGLSEAQWKALQERFAGHEAWLAGKQGGAVEGLGRERLRACLQGPWPQAVRALLAQDHTVAEKLAGVRKLAQLLLYQKHLLAFANNFVSFPDLYNPGRRAMFETGSLVIDGRWFNLAIRVADVKQHKDVARSSRIFVIYAELTRADSTQTSIVALPATSGTIGNLAVGKRGVFHGIDGLTYDARVVDIIENPISFREAMAAPFVRLGQFIGGKIEAISGTAQKALETQVGQVTDRMQTDVQQTVQQAPQLVQQAGGAPAAAVPASSSARRDLLVGASFSIAALSSAFAFATKQFSALQRPLSTIALTVLVILIVVSLPTAVVAGWKLARRDLSSILEGCGWAINARMRLNRRQRGQFTRSEPYPQGATGTPGQRLLPLLLVILLAALLAFGAYKLWPRHPQPPVSPRAPAPLAPSAE